MKRFLFLFIILLLLPSFVQGASGRDVVYIPDNRPLLKEAILENTSLSTRETDPSRSLFPFGRTHPIGISSQYARPFVDDGFFFYPLAYNYLVMVTFDGTSYPTFAEAFASGKTMILPFSLSMEYVARMMALEYGSLSKVKEVMKEMEREDILRMRSVRDKEYGSKDQILVLFEWDARKYFDERTITITYPRYGSGYILEGILSPYDISRYILKNPGPKIHYPSLDLSERATEMGFLGKNNLDANIKRSIFHIRLYSPETPVEFLLSYTLMIPLLCLFFVLIYFQVVRKRTRYYLMAFVVLMLFWIQMRMLKRFSIGGPTERMFWYLYYVPFLFIPTIMYLSVADYRPGKVGHDRKQRVLYSISAFLLLMTLTNSLHQQCFILHEEAGRTLYSYNWGYFLILLYCMALIGGAIFEIYRKTRHEDNSMAFLGTSCLMILLVIYIGGYIRAIPFFRNSEIVLTEILFACAYLLILMHTGLITTNRGYGKVITDSPVPLALTDTAGNIVMHSSVEGHFSQEAFQAVTSSRLKEFYVSPTHRLNAYPISGGFFLWENDLTDVIMRQQSLASINRDLQRETKTLERERAILEDLSEHLWQERIYQALDTALYEDLDELEDLIIAYEGLTAEQKTPARLAMVTIKAVSVKRKGNILLSGNFEGGSFTESSIPGREIAYALEEFMGHVQAAQIPMEIMMDEGLSLKKNFALHLVGLVAEILEESLRTKVESIFFNIFSQGEALHLIVMVEQGKGQPDYSFLGEETDDFPGEFSTDDFENTLTLKRTFPKEVSYYD